MLRGDEEQPWQSDRGRYGSRWGRWARRSSGCVCRAASLRRRRAAVVLHGLRRSRNHREVRPSAVRPGRPAREPPGRRARRALGRCRRAAPRRGTRDDRRTPVMSATHSRSGPSAAKRRSKRRRAFTRPACRVVTPRADAQHRPWSLQPSLPAVASPEVSSGGAPRRRSSAEPVLVTRALTGASTDAQPVCNREGRCSGGVPRRGEQGRGHGTRNRHQART
jgi:hypothetical protein